MNKLIDSLTKHTNEFLLFLTGSLKSKVQMIFLTPFVIHSFYVK